MFLCLPLTFVIIYLDVFNMAFLTSLTNLTSPVFV